MNVSDKWVEEYAENDRWEPVTRELAQDLREARAALVWAMANAKTCVDGSEGLRGFSLWSVPESFEKIMQHAYDIAFPDKPEGK